MQASTYAIAVLGLTIVLGYSGQINLGQAAFFGIGAYGVALGTTSFGAAILGCSGDRGRGRRRVAGAVLGLMSLRLGRPLPRHGDDQLPDDSVAGADQLGRVHARTRRHLRNRPRQPILTRATAAIWVSALPSSVSWATWCGICAKPSWAAPCRPRATTN